MDKEEFRNLQAGFGFRRPMLAKLLYRTIDTVEAYRCGALPIPPLVAHRMYAIKAALDKLMDLGE